MEDKKPTVHTQEKVESEFGMIGDIKLLEKEMKIAAKNLDFERAAEIRDLIKKIRIHIKEDFTNRAKARLDTLTNTQEWGATAQRYINAELERFIGESAGSIFSAMLAPTMQNALQMLRGQLGY